MYVLERSREISILVAYDAHTNSLELRPGKTRPWRRPASTPDYVDDAALIGPQRRCEGPRRQGRGLTSGRGRGRRAMAICKPVSAAPWAGLPAA